MPHLESIRQDTNGQLFITLDWGYRSNGFAAAATQKIADMINRLWYAQEVTLTDDSSLTVRLRAKRKTWSLVEQPISKRAIERLIRTINNAMPRIAFWTPKAVWKERMFNLITAHSPLG